MSYTYSENICIAIQWRIRGGGGARAPPFKNCIQDRDTLIEQSNTLIKQSQCSRGITYEAINKDFILQNIRDIIYIW